MHCESKARYLLRIWLYFYFLRAVVNISIQTLLFSPWLLFRKMIISQLDLGLPVVDLETALWEWGERFHRRSPEWFIKQLQSLSLLYSPNDPVSTFIVNLSVWGCFVFFCLLSSCCCGPRYAWRSNNFFSILISPTRISVVIDSGSANVYSRRKRIAEGKWNIGREDWRHLFFILDDHVSSILYLCFPNLVKHFAMVWKCYIFGRVYRKVSIPSLFRYLVLSFSRSSAFSSFVFLFFRSFILHFSRMFHSFFIPNSVILSISSFFLVLFPRFFYKPKGRLFKRSVSYTLFTAYKGIQDRRLLFLSW